MSNIKLAILLVVTLPILALGCQGCGNKAIPLRQGTSGFTLKSTKVNGELQADGTIVVSPGSATKFVIELIAPKGTSKVSTGVVNMLQNDKSGGVASLQSGTVLYKSVGKDIYEATFELDVPEYSGEAMIQLRDTQKSIAEIPCKSAKN